MSSPFAHKSLVLAGGALFALAGIGVTFRACSDARPVASISPPPQAAAPALGALVNRVDGFVERRSSQNDWKPLAPGDRLLVDDALRTGQNANAELVIGKGTRVELTERSEFRIGKLSDTLSQLKLEGGRMQARVAAGGDTLLRVEVKDSDAVVETRAGDFAMLRAPDAQLTVATREGSVEVTAQRQRVRLGEGEQSVVPAGQPPSRPSRIPTSLFLKIARVPRRLNKASAQIGGETTPGAVLSINGQPVPVRADGSFSADVPLAEGDNDVVISAQDAVGRSEQQTLPKVTVDTKGPSLKGRVVW